jgi:hypothetical protein
MDIEIMELRQQWIKARPALPKPVPSSVLLQKAKARKRSSILFQYSNIAILLGVMVLLYLYFCQWFPFRGTLGKTGVGLMIGSLALRILIEAGSTFRSRRILLDGQLSENTKAAVQYYQFRKNIHGTVTYIIVALYTLGFYMLMPEFSKHAPLWLTIITALSYPCGAVIIIYQIRKGIRKEMDQLNELIELQAVLAADR